jgi:subtilisin family serine protease
MILSGVGMTAYPDLGRFAVNDRMRVHIRSLFVLLLIGPLFAAAQAPAVQKQKITSANEMPRFSYPMQEAPSKFLTSDDATFNALAAKVEHDIDSLLAKYDIADKATLRSLYATKLDVEVLTGENQAALETANQLRDLQEKPEAKATSGMLDRPMLQARLSAHADSGPAFDEAFKTGFKSSLDSLDWKLAQDRIKGTKTSFEIVSPSLLVASEKQGLDPAAAQTKTVDLEAAESMIEDRTTLKVILPLKPEILPILTAYVTAHNVQKPDIWPAREVTLTASDHLTPVRIGIWDSGVDTSLYPDQLFTDPSPDGHSPHGLAYDVHGNLYDGDLQPLTPELKAAYPKMLALEQGLDDLQNSIDSPAAADARKTLGSMPPDQLAPFLQQASFLSQWMHGTHVAGIAVRGDPAARLVVAQFYDSLPDIPFPPTVEWAEKFKHDFQQIGEYFNANHVRVVNMSWGDDVGEFEQWLTKTSSEKDPAVRKQQAQAVFKIWREAIENAIRSAPDTLFICAAGNSNSNAEFLGDAPPSLHLPNLIAVGAVDQAGEETSFTSYGDTVVVDADGYEVESYVPGGTKLRLSGTSMASPNVVNLAAKLIALDPSLTPQQTIALIEKGADKSADGRRNLINPKATVALLKQQTAGSASH